MSNPFYNTEAKLQFWINKYNQEFERANGLEIALTHATYEIKNLQTRISDLVFELEKISAQDRIENLVEETLGKVEIK